MKLLLTILLLQLLLILLCISGIESNPGPFPCKVCSAVPETIASSLRHQVLHSVSKKFLYHCPDPSCIVSTKSFNYLNQHVSIFHRETSHDDPVAVDSLRCVYISGGLPCAFSTTSIHKLVQHLCDHLDSNVEVECPINGCDFTKCFRKKSTFRVHLSQYHPNWLAEGCPKRNVRQCGQGDFGILQASDEAMQSEDEGPGCSNEENFELLNDSDVLNCIAKFYLQLYGLHTLPYETIQDICDGLICISEIVQAKIKLVLTQELEKSAIPESQISIICDKVSHANHLYASHHKDKSTGPFFTSDHLRRKYFQENFGFCPPMEINLDKDDPESNLKQEIIPITPALLRLFNDPVVCQDIDDSFLKQVEPSSNIVSDYTQGQQFISENHPPKELHLFIYQDTVNAVMNVLGSAKNKYKLLTMYFTLGNLKPHRRARVESKNLILIMRESVFKTVGQEKSLQEVISEIKVLETEGILYKGKQVKVVVTFIQGDSLGQHLIGGFIECFSSDYFCRFCNIRREEFKAEPTLIKPPRTRADYNQCFLKALASGKPCKGIKNSSEFNDLKYVHAATHLVPCLAHDLFEGVVSWDLSGVISYLVEEEWFTYKWLNSRIKSLKCVGADSPNKPALVNKDGLKLGGHAVQNWTLLRLLPFIICNKIKDVDNPAWQLYLILKTLCEYFTAPSFMKTDLPYIQDVLLPKYFQLRAEVLASEKYPLKPKHHFMMHYPELLVKYGPLIHLWTLPYEQRHKFFKHLLRLTQNFINPEWSCAYRYQINISYIASNGPVFSEESVEVGAKQMNHNDYHRDLGNAISSSLTGSGWRDCTSVNFSGIKYQREQVLLLAEAHGNIVVGVIKVIAAKESLLRFVCEIQEAVPEPSLRTYILPDPGGRLTTISFCDLKYPVPHPVYFFKGKMSISLKHKLIENN